MQIPSLSSRRPDRKSGFTLIELMIVVAIIGILAAIAIPNFLRYQMKAKTSEGKTNLSAVRAAQAAYYAEYNFYASATVSPNVATGNQKHAFVGSSGFDELGWAPSGAVWFTYAVGTDAGGQIYHATAHANIDADAESQIWHYRSGTTESNTHVGVPPLECEEDAGRANVVEPCHPDFGQSVF